jgi:STE24 endopeptidase
MRKWGSALALALLSLPLVIAAAHGADFDPKAATEAYLATVAGEAREKSDAYFEGGYWLILWDALYAIGVSLILLFTRLSSGMRSLAERMVSWRWLQTAIFAVLYTLVTAALTFPLSIYTGFYREHEYGLSNMTLNEWAAQFATGLAVGVVFSAVFITVLYAIVRRMPNTWWIGGSVAAIILMTISIALGPVFISPLFNDYKPMREGPLKEEILSMARANGVPAENVYEFDASKQSKRISANVSGFAGTTRISLNDNLLNRTTPAETKAVMGHELGHYVLNHVYEMLITLSVIIVIGFAFVNGGFHVLNRTFGGWWGVRDITDPAGLPIAMLLFVLFELALTPVTNTMIRTNEAEADIFGLNAAREPDGFATTALKLSEYRKLDPTPWEEFIFFDHPSGRSRISMAMQWKAEHLKEIEARKAASQTDEQPVTQPEAPPAEPAAPQP